MDCSAATRSSEQPGGLSTPRMRRCETTRPGQIGGLSSYGLDVGWGATCQDCDLSLIVVSAGDGWAPFYCPVDSFRCLFPVREATKGGKATAARFVHHLEVVQYLPWYPIKPHSPPSPLPSQQIPVAVT